MSSSRLVPSLRGTVTSAESDRQMLYAEIFLYLVNLVGLALKRDLIHLDYFPILSLIHISEPTRRM